MSEFKGTKGQWYIDKELGYVNDYDVEVKVISSDNSEKMIEIFGNNEEAQANALLISKAPELLDFLKKYYRFLNLDDQKKAEKLIKEATDI